MSTSSSRPPVSPAASNADGPTASAPTARPVLRRPAVAAKAAPVRPAPAPRPARAPAPPNYRTATGAFVAPVRQAPVRAAATVAANGLVTSRLNKRMAELGLCSRREADDWIAQGWVKVNGEVAPMGLQVTAADRIDVDKVAQDFQEQRVTILLHKPMGYVSGQAEDGHTPAVALINPRTHWRDDPSRHRFSPPQLRGLAPAGRLDIDSVGLLVLTQDGRVARQIIGEDSEMEKEYLVRVVYQAPGQAVPRHPSERSAPLQEIDERDPVSTNVQAVFPTELLERLRHGLSLDGEALKPAKVDWQNPEQLRFVLTEGKKRQIRRMCELVGLKVVGLKRIRIGRVTLGNLPAGQWRYLSPQERF
ncbi:pseudouridine synthase [Acidovorax sp. 69]|nr:pseudouridine synthase [Acidovorax sp. 69]